MAITIHLRYTGKNGAARKFAEEMTSGGTLAAVRAEPGNLRYEYYLSLEDPETVLLIDSWTDQAALNAHHASAMMETIAALRERYDLSVTAERFTDAETPESDKRFLGKEPPVDEANQDIIELRALLPEDRDQFIRDNQEAFRYGALEEFGRRDDHFEEDGEIISRETIEASINGGEAYRITRGGVPVGGVVIKVKGNHGDLELLFVSPKSHSRGIGLAAWRAIERLHPEVTVWETVTPYFETRNIHFYVNRCGFRIVEFYNSHHPDPNDPDAERQTDDRSSDGMFRFEKRMR